MTNIKIEIPDVTKPPILYVDGERVIGIVSIDIQYNSDNSNGMQQHKYLIKQISKEDGVIKTIGEER